MLRAEHLDAIASQAYAEYPLEMCGLLTGTNGATVTAAGYVPCTNEAASAKVYTVPAIELLRAERAAQAVGHEVIGVVHSHTHTEPYPSPTDVAQAPDPTWTYVIVSLKRTVPESRAYRIVDGTITEVPISVADG